MIIVLTKEEKNFAREIGLLRQEENKRRNNIPDYDDNRFNLKPEQAGSLGAMVEVAIGKALGFNMLEVGPDIWAGFVKDEGDNYKKYLTQPDIGGRVECRRANKPWSPIPLKKKDVDTNALVVQGYVAYTQQVRRGPIQVPSEVELLGWSNAVEDWAGGVIPSYSVSGDSRSVQRRPIETFDFNLLSDLV